MDNRNFCAKCGNVFFVELNSWKERFCSYKCFDEYTKECIAINEKNNSVEDTIQSDDCIDESEAKPKKK